MFKTKNMAIKLNKMFKCLIALMVASIVMFGECINVFAEYNGDGEWAGGGGTDATDSNFSTKGDVIYGFRFSLVSFDGKSVYGTPANFITYSKDSQWGTYFMINGSHPKTYWKNREGGLLTKAPKIKKASSVANTTRNDLNNTLKDLDTATKIKNVSTNMDKYLRNTKSINWLLGKIGYDDVSTLGYMTSQRLLIEPIVCAKIAGTRMLLTPTEIAEYCNVFGAGGSYIKTYALWSYQNYMYLTKEQVGLSAVSAFKAPPDEYNSNNTDYYKRCKSCVVNGYGVNIFYRPGYTIKYTPSSYGNGNPVEKHNKIGSGANLQKFSTMNFSCKEKGWVFANEWKVYRESDGKYRGYNKNKESGFYAKSTCDTYGYNNYTDGQTGVKPTSVDGDVVKLIAQWRKSKYTVKYNKNASDATGTMKDQTVTIHNHSIGTTCDDKCPKQKCTTRNNAFSRKYYKMTGWKAYRKSTNTWRGYNEVGKAGFYSKATCDKYGYALYKSSSADIYPTWEDGDIVTLYAQWEPVKITFNYFSNNAITIKLFGKDYSPTDLKLTEKTIKYSSSEDIDYNGIFPKYSESTNTTYLKHNKYPSKNQWGTAQNGGNCIEVDEAKGKVTFLSIAEKLEIASILETGKDVIVNLYPQWKVDGDALSISFVEPNSDYRNSTTVFSTFNVKALIGDIRSKDNIVPVLTIYDDKGTVILTKQLDKIMCPENGTTSVWAKWTIPENTKFVRMSLHINDTRIKDNEQEYETSVTKDIKDKIISQTPDTTFGRRAPSYYKSDNNIALIKPYIIGSSEINSDISQTSDTVSMYWYTWTDSEDTADETSDLKQIQHEVSISRGKSSTSTIIPTNSGAKYNRADKMWTTKAGYGFTLESKMNKNYITTSEGDNDCYTDAQNIFAVFPEFNYETVTASRPDSGGWAADKYILNEANEINGYKQVAIDENNELYKDGLNGGEYGTFATLIESGDKYQLPVNTSMLNNEHYIPIWFSKGEYKVYTYSYDIWTPAGMLGDFALAGTLNIDGNLYEDYYSRVY